MNSDSSLNPYLPPASPLEERQVSRRLWWKAYLWIMVALVCVALAMMMLLGDPQFLDLVDFVAMGFSCLGTFGYCYRRPLLSNAFWRWWAPLVFVWDGAIQFLLEPAGMIYRFPEIEPATSGEAALGLLVALPIYAALYLYGYRSGSLWVPGRGD
jgi:hypothetical protein